MRPLIAVLVALNIAVWGGVLVFERTFANGVTVTSTATVSPHDAQFPGH